MKAGRSTPEILFEKHLGELGLKFQREFRFHPTRKWKFDFLLPDFHIAIEIEGGSWTQGRHTRGAGFQADLDKYNQATAMGYRVLRFSTRDALTGRAKAFLAEHQDQLLKFSTFPQAQSSTN